MVRTPSDNPSHENRPLRWRTTRWLSRSLVLVGALLLGLASTAGAVSVVVLDDWIHTPAVYAGTGNQAIDLINKSSEKTTFNVYRLLDGASLVGLQQATTDLDEAMANGGDAVPALTALVEQAEALSGVAVSAHSEETMIVDLESGTYVIVARPDDGGDVMYSSFHVTRGGDEGADLNVENEVDLSDFAIDIADSVDSGDTLWKVSNTGEQVHAADFYRLLPGKTVEDLMAYINEGGGRAPYDETASIEALTPGAEAYVPLDLEAGSWVAVCLVPDMENAQLTHAMEGMIAEFRVD